MLKNRNLTKWILGSFCFLLIGRMNAQGIQFEHGTWEEVKAKALKESKPIFVDAYTSWCGPCKWMAKNVFVQEEVGAFFNENFITYKMDMEKGEGPAFAKANRVNAYPTLLYFDKNGDILHKGVGARDADGLIALSKEALDPKKQLASFVKKYEQGEKSKEFLMAYLEVLASCGENLEKPFDELWQKMTEKEKQSAESLDLMAAASYNFSDLKSPLTQYLLENRTAYEKNAGKETVAMMLSACYARTTWKIAKTEDKKAQKAMIKEVLDAFPEAKKEFKKRLAYTEATMENPPNEAKIQKTRLQYLNVTNNSEELNSAAWGIYENEDDLKKLKTGLEWVNRSIAIKANYFNLDTKAALLYKMKKYEEAKVFAEKAIDASEKAGFEEAPEDTVKLLENINAKLENK